MHGMIDVERAKFWGIFDKDCSLEMKKMESHNIRFDTVS